MASSLKTDPGLVKTCVFLLKIFSIGIICRSGKVAHGTHLLALVYRTFFSTAVLIYALSKIVYFLSLLSYSGSVIEFRTVSH